MNLVNKAASVFLGVTVLMVGVSANALEVGDKAPAVILRGVAPANKAIVSPIVNVVGDGQSYTLLEFFNTDNVESKQNLSDIVDLSIDTEEFVGTRLVATNPETADVLAYIKDNGTDIRFPVHFDDKGDAVRAFGVKTIPTIFVLRDEKTIIYKHEGALTPDAIDAIRKAVGFSE